MAFVSLDKMPCYDPSLFAQNVANLRGSSSRQYLDIAGRARLALLCNRWANVSGPTPSYGYFAVSRKTVDALAKSSSITLRIDQTSGGAYSKPMTQEGLVMVKATAMAPIMPPDGGEGDADAYVVEIADRRYLGNHPHMRLDSAGFKLFNTPAIMYGEGEYYANTINPDTVLPWTWQEMLEELWPTWLGGEAPELPYDLEADPIGFDFRAYTNYQAIQIILNHLTLSLALDTDGTYYLINAGTVDESTPVNNQLFKKFTAAQSEDVEWTEPIMSYYPKGVRVLFQKMATQPGSENTYPKTSGDQWYVEMLHTVTVDAGDDQLSELDRGKLLADTYHQIWDDMPAWVDPFSGTISNTTDLDDRANERMVNYYANIVKEQYRVHGVYSAVVPFEICGTMQAVNYVQQQVRGGAWTTEYWCHPRIQMKVEGGILVPVTVKPVEPWQWRSVPVYPYETAFVRVEDEPDEDGLYPVTEVRTNADDLTSVDGITALAFDPN